MSVLLAEHSQIALVCRFRWSLKPYKVLEGPIQGELSDQAQWSCRLLRYVTSYSHEARKEQRSLLFSLTIIKIG